MSLNAYRAYALGLRCSAHGPAALSPRSNIGRSRNVTARTYVTESALASKKKGSPSAKSTHKATAVSSAAPQRTSTKVEQRASGHAGTPATEAKTMPLQSKSKGVHVTAKGSTSLDASTASTDATKAAPKTPELTQEQNQLRELEAIQYFQQIMKSSDPWGQPIPDSLDVLVPRPAGLTKIFSYGLKGWWNQFRVNRLNDSKNAMSILTLAADDAIPGKYLGNIPWYKAFAWVPNAFTVKSTKSKSWLAPLRGTLLQSYKDLNTTLASRDVKGVKALTTSGYQQELLRRLKLQPSGFHFKWNMEREVSPTQILSMRTAQYYLAKENPKFGSRYLVNVLVKFDTEQSLEIYGPKGEVLHEVAEGAVKRPNGTIPAKPKRVTEYLVLEKRLWYDVPWVFREQKWDAPTGKI